MSQEEIAIEVLGKKSGYMRGFGVGPKPFNTLIVIAQSRSHNEELRNLKDKISSLEELNAAQNRRFENLMTLLEQNGTLSRSRGGESSSGAY